MDKKEQRKAYKYIRDIHPMNDRPSRRYWGSKYITAPNHAGLYVESIRPDSQKPEWYVLRQIAKDSEHWIERAGVKVPYINTVPNNRFNDFFENEWQARQALKFWTMVYDSAANRELFIWHNAHTITTSRDTPGIVIFYTDHYKKSAEVDTDMGRNGNGKRLWTN